MKCQHLSPAPLQLSIALESTCLHDMDLEDREQAVMLLAQLLLEASGLAAEEPDSEESHDENC